MFSSPALTHQTPFLALLEGSEGVRDRDTAIGLKLTFFSIEFTYLHHSFANLLHFLY